MTPHVFVAASASHLTGWVSVLFISVCVIACGLALESEMLSALTPARRNRIIAAILIALFVATVGSELTQAVYWDSTVYCSWAWWDFIVC